jgi:hypothetical protein
MSVFALLLLTQSPYELEEQLLPRTVAVPEVRWTCALHSLDDSTIKISGNFEKIPASKNKPLKVHDDIAVKGAVLSDTSFKMIGKLDANFQTLTNSYRASMTKGENTYFMDFDFAHASGRAFAVLSVSPTAFVGRPYPFALGFCIYDPPIDDYSESPQ